MRYYVQGKAEACVVAGVDLYYVCGSARVTAQSGRSAGSSTGPLPYSTEHWPV